MFDQMPVHIIHCLAKWHIKIAFTIGNDALIAIQHTYSRQCQVERECVDNL